VHTWPVAEVAAQAGEEGPLEVEVRQVTLPERTARCEFLSGDPGEQAAALVQRLRELKLL